MENKAIYDPKTKRYQLANGDYLSSPSRILRPLTIDKYKDIPLHYLEMAMEFGKQIHEIIEIYEKLGEDMAAIEDSLFSNNLKNTFKQYLDWKKENFVEVLETEKVVWNVKHRYFGYIDSIVQIVNKKYIVDYKTRSNLKSDDNYFVETLQLMLYADAYYEMTGERIDIALLVINKKTKTKRNFIIIDPIRVKNLKPLLNALKKANVELLRIKEENIEY